MVPQRSYLLVIGDREALAWIVSSQQMAFPSYRRRSSALLRPGDNLLLYTTRGCFRNPTLDRGRVLGHATVASAVSVLDAPVEFDGRVFPVGCSLAIHMLTPYRTGVELAEYVPLMNTFSNPSIWGTSLRRVLVPIDDHDFNLLLRALTEIAIAPSNVISEYVAHGIPPRNNSQRSA